MPRLTDLSPNMGAFLDLIAESEGTSAVPDSDDGYRVLVTSTPKNPILFGAYATHPYRKMWIRGLQIWSTAAGRYQMIGKTWDMCQKALSLPSFEPINQDKAAIFLIKSRKANGITAYEDVEAGRIREAVIKCASEWASFPGNDYGQRQNPIEGLLAVYRTFGGAIA